MSNPNSLPALQGLPAIEGVDKLTGEDLAVLQYVLQATQTVNIVKMRKQEESRIPIGSQSFTFLVTDTISCIPLNPPWISYTLINDGAGDIYSAINNISDLLTGAAILSGETESANMVYPIIKCLYFKTTTAGATASIRVKGKVGREQFQVS